MPVLGGTTIARNAGVTRGDVAGLIRHHFRDVDRKHGREVQHSNDGIVASRTPWNESFVNDGNGGLKPCEDSSEVLNFIETRLDSLPPRMRRQKDGSYKPVKLRKDFPVLRDWVLSLDPESMADYTEAVELLEKSRELDDEESVKFYEARVEEERAEIRRLLGVMIERLRVEVTPANFVGGSIHWDEGKPHAQVLTLPISDEKLNWKAFRPGNKFLNPAFHDDMRQSLRDAGYMAFEERVSGGAKHMKLAEYKDFKRSLAELHRLEDTVDAPQQRINELQETIKAYELSHHRLDGLSEREADVEQREAALEVRSAELDRRSTSLDVRASGLDAREAALEEGQRAHEAATAALRRQQADLERRRREFEESLETRREEVLSQAEKDADNIRDEARTKQNAVTQVMVNDGKALREVLNRARGYVGRVADVVARQETSQEFQALLREAQSYGVRTEPADDHTGVQTNTSSNDDDHGVG